MTTEKLQEILALAKIDEQVKGLQETSFDKLPKWTDLVKQYDPKQHKIWDTNVYPIKMNENQQDDFKRTAFALQKLAVSRIAQMMFATPVQRVYSFNKDSKTQAQAADILEELYRMRNFIDSENVERGKMLNASCQVATVWWTYDRPDIINEIPITKKLSHKSYAEIDGYSLYPITDDNGELLVLSIAWTSSSDIEFMVTYTAAPSIQAIKYQKGEKGWEIIDKQVLTIFPVIYANISEPVWGGDDGTNLVEQMEEMESYDGMYIKRNSAPTFTLDYGDTTGGKPGTTEEKSDDSRRIIRLGKGGAMNDVTWPGAGESLTNRFQRLRNAFFEQVQMPDISFANLINSNTSAENKELLFSDAKSKARDLGGEWEKLFYAEIEIVKEFAKVIFPQFAEDFANIQVRSVIKPYSIKNTKENAEYVNTAGGAMSLNTKVRILDEVDDVDEEVLKIQEEQNTQSNQLI